MLAPNHQFEIIIFPAYYATFWFLYYDGALNSSLHLQREGVPRHTNRDVEVRSKCVLVASRTGLYMLDYRTCPPACLFDINVFFSHDY